MELFVNPDFKIGFHCLFLLITKDKQKWINRLFGFFKIQNNTPESSICTQILSVCKGTCAVCGWYVLA